MNDRCEHGVLWSMECLSCGHSDYAPAPPTQPEGEQENCLGCIASRAGVGRCRIHEPECFTTAPSSGAIAAPKVAKEEHYLDPTKFGEGHENVNPEDHLSPCPFCNSTELSRCWDDGLYWIRCVSCGATGPETTKRSDEDAPDWNSRASAQPITTTQVERWVCFHCNAMLTGRAEAEAHFGVGRSVVNMLPYLHQGAGEPECRKHGDHQ